MMVETNQGHNSSYISMAVYRYNSTFTARKYNNIGEWYHNAYNMGEVHTLTLIENQERNGSRLYQ